MQVQCAMHHDRTLLLYLECAGAWIEYHLMGVCVCTCMDVSGCVSVCVIPLRPCVSER